MAENHKNTRDDVIIRITGDSKNPQIQTSKPPIPQIDSTFTPPNPNNPPKIPKSETLNRRKSISRSLRSKPKSRFGEQSMIPIDDDDNNPLEDDDDVASSHGNSIDEHEEIYMKVSSKKKRRHRKLKAKVLIQCLLLLCVIVCLIVSLTVNRFENRTVWGLRIWRWCVLVLVTFSGLFFTKWLMHFVVLLIELNYLLKKKVLYFVYGLKKSVRVCIWLALVLLTWVLLIREGVERSGRTGRALDLVTWTITSSLIGSSLWLSKTLLLKILASSFHVNTFFDRIQDSVFHQYVVLTLSGPPKNSENVGKFSPPVVKTKKKKNHKEEKEVIDINKLHRMKQEKVSAWTMKMLVDVISNSGLTTLSNAIDESVYGGNSNSNVHMDKEINNEEEAIAAAYHIFRNVARPGCKYIDEVDVSRFMTRDEVEVVFPMIDVAETGMINRKNLTDWVVKVYKGRKALAHALTDTKTAVKQLNKLISVILVAIMIIVWLLLVGIATTKVLVFLSSQLVLAVFVFGNTCKTIFEAIIFVFVMHPFDVGDRCVIDGVQMIVEEMNILTTVFLRYDNEKIYYPNSVLATKPISNFYRSPDMGDSFDFSIDFKTPVEKIGSLKLKIKQYLENNPGHWHPNHNVVVKGIENVNKIKMALYFNHTMNFQDFGEKSKRRTDLVLEMKKIFEELNIRYNLLPQEIHLVEWGKGDRKISD